jgi:hypothetical protein
MRLRLAKSYVAGWICTVAAGGFDKCELKRGPSEKRDENCHVLADSLWEIILKAVRQPLSIAKRV